MARQPALSKGELEVARVLWDLEEATPRQVFEAYPNRRKIDFSTVQTYLRRLESKGYVRARREGRTKFYRPKKRPSTVIRQIIEDLVDRLFDGQALPLMRHLIQQRGISKEELDALRRMLSHREAEHDEASQR